MSNLHRLSRFLASLKRTSRLHGQYCIIRFPICGQVYLYDDIYWADFVFWLWDVLGCWSYRLSSYLYQIRFNQQGRGSISNIGECPYRCHTLISQWCPSGFRGAALSILLLWSQGQLYNIRSYNPVILFALQKLSAICFLAKRAQPLPFSLSL